MRYVLGVDQGGTKTHAMVADENGTILGFGQSGGAYHATDGIDAAMDRIEEAIHSAIEESGIALDDVAVMAAGITGIDWDYEKDLLRDALQSRFPTEKTVAVNDCIIALRAGTRAERGAVLCAGTGFNCAVRRDRDHEIVYGYYISDDLQGGRALGQQCVSAVLEAHLGLSEPTSLTEALFARFQVSNADELLYRLVTGKIGDKELSKLPPLLDRTALEGDAVARSILRRFGEGWARYALAGMKKLSLLDKPLDVVLSGSVFKCQSPELVSGVNAGLSDEAPMARLVRSRYEPIVGAVLLALDELYGICPETVYSRLEEAETQFDILR